jgi:TonB family protein
MAVTANATHFQEVRVDRLPRRAAEIIIVICIGLSGTLVPNRAWAEDAGTPPADTGAPPDAQQTPELVPPDLVESAEATYPEQARSERLEGTVVLRLSIDVDGQVTEAEVIEPAGHGFDEAAREAALRFRFAPARRDGQPVPSRIRYPVVFKLGPEAPPAPATGTIAGRLTMDGTAIAGAEVTLTGPEGRTSTVTTDAEGRFRASDLSPGRYQARAVRNSRTATGTIDVAAAAEAALELTFAALPAPVRPIAEQPVEVTVHGQSAAQRLRESAEAVHVVDTEEAKRESADLGEVLAREQGVGVRRDGGLGSSTRFSLNGLTDDQIRFFVDGIPMELSGYPLGIGNMPVNLVHRVEVFRGVVPIRFGADALGGAVNLVTHEVVKGGGGAVSYQEGSFGTRRITLGGRYMSHATGLFVRASGFFDSADNDYRVEVEVPDPHPDRRGQLTRADAYRFHDGYRALGAMVEGGVVRRAWADRLVLRLFGSDLVRELQTNPTMDVAYGEAGFARGSLGSALTYQSRIGRALSIEAVAGYTRTRTPFRDVSTCIYNWFGQCVRLRQGAGEIGGSPRDDTLFDDAGYGRVTLGYRPHPRHALRLSASPTLVGRREQDRTLPDGLWPPRRSVFSNVAGLEYEIDTSDDRLENIAFVKSYFQTSASDEPVLVDVRRELGHAYNRVGAGDALRFRLVRGLWAKASYEYATRLPRPDELFGDAVFTNGNPDLAPEASHNANLGLTLDLARTRRGAWHADLNGFLRDAQNLIVLLAAYGERFRYENVFAARSAGVEASAGWTSPGQRVSLDGNVTYLDFRNLTGTGPFAPFEGDRIPNRPYFFANGSIQVAQPDLFVSGDRLSLGWHSRFVNEFFEFWESAGTAESKRIVPDQMLHSAVLTYRVRGQRRMFSFSGEVSNLTDAKAFDFFGAQRPGRAAYFKTTAEF